METEIVTLVDRVSAGDEAAFAELCTMYEPLVRSMTKHYAGMINASDDGQSAEDFSQEAIIALYRAAKTYRRGNGEVSFGLYAKVCIRNALVSELRRLNRKQRSDMKQKNDSHIVDAGRMILPDESVIADLIHGDSLSHFEKEVLKMYVSGAKVRDMAKALGRSSKSVSNAVYRIKSKLRANFEGDSE